MQRLVSILLAGIMIMALAACGTSANADSDTVTKANRQCDVVQQDLDDARAEETDQAGTPGEPDAAQAVEDLETELETCDNGSTTSTTEATADEGNTEDEADAEPTDCPERFVVDLHVNELNRVLEHGIQGPTSEDMRDRVRRLNRTDPNAFMLYLNASPLGESDPYRTAAEIVEGGVVEEGACYTAQAQQAYSEWKVLWDNADIVPVNSMPSGWGNTGVTEAGPSVGGAPSGDTSGWMVVFRDATGRPIGMHGVMKRCGNPVVPAPPPHIPEGPTDQPPPVCPPGMPHGSWPICKDGPDRDPAQNGNVPTQVQGQAPPVNGPATPPAAGTPPATYNPPAPPPAPQLPPVTAPPTTSPPATTPPTTAPPVVTILPPR